MKLPRVKIDKIKNFCKKLPRILAEQAFLTFLGLLFLVLIFGSIIFYKYSILAQRVELQPPEKSLRFQTKTYQEVLKFWQEREKRFQETELKKYPDPFKKLTERGS